jgi:hypothetical protein
MTQDDAAARKARAEKLRKQITKLTESDGEAKDSPPAKESDAADAKSSSKGVAPEESPREFIQRRMRQIDQEGKKNLD